MTTTRCLPRCPPCTKAITVWRRPVRLLYDRAGTFVLVNGLAVEASAKSDEAGLTRWREHVCQPREKTTTRKARKGNKR